MVVARTVNGLERGLLAVVETDAELDLGDRALAEVTDLRRRVGRRSGGARSSRSCSSRSSLYENIVSGRYMRLCGEHTAALFAVAVTVIVSSTVTVSVTTAQVESSRTACLTYASYALSWRKGRAWTRPRRGSTRMALESMVRFWTREGS